MGESLEGAGNVAFHGNVDIAFVVVPVDVEAAVVLALPVFCDCVARLESVSKVKRIFGCNVFDTEVVDCKTE